MIGKKYLEFYWNRIDETCIEVEQEDPNVSKEWIKHQRSYYEGYTGISSDEGIRNGLWGNINGIVDDVYFDCSKRWANIKITDYPIQPPKKEWGSEEGVAEHNPDGSLVLTLDDPWVCGQGKEAQLGDDIWISSGRASDPLLDIREEPDRAELVISNATAYKYKYDTYTHGLLVRKSIAEYAPLPHYPDEVEKRNFQAELEERLLAMAVRRNEIDVKLNELRGKLDDTWSEINYEIQLLNAEKSFARTSLYRLQSQYNLLSNDDKSGELGQAILEQIQVLEDRILNIDNQISILSQGTIQTKAIEEWIADLEDERCRIDQQCIENKLYEIRSEIGTRGEEYDNLVSERVELEVEFRQKTFNDEGFPSSEEGIALQQEIDNLTLEIEELYTAIYPWQKLLKEWEKELWKF